ncbi:MAG: four helix bundle protein [Candidatus Neomarinimicrobiota bacterium]
MSTFKSFTEIEAWQKARDLNKKVYEITSDPVFQKDFEFRKQIRSASLSVISNIAEGFERSGNAEFLQFLYIAKGSAGEVLSLLYVATDLGYISQSSFDSLSASVKEVSNKIGGLIKHIKQSNFKGSKYK